MALNSGNITCTSGLAKEIHDFMIKKKENGGMGATDTIEMPVLDSNGMATGEITEEDTLLRRLCFNLSKIILDYIKENMEIVGVEVNIGDVSTQVNGTYTGVCTGPGGGPCNGTINGTGLGHATGQQSNNGVGRIN